MVMARHTQEKLDSTNGVNSFRNQTNPEMRKHEKTNIKKLYWITFLGGYTSFVRLRYI
jgi:hypothetical protein